MDLLTIGDVAIDLYMKVESGTELETSEQNTGPKICFIHGSKIPVEHFETAVAGNALNVALGCKTLGLQTALYSELGEDANADRVISELADRGVDTKFCIKNANTPTNVHTVIVYGGERTIFSYHEKRNYKIQKWDKPKWIYYTSMGEGFENFQTDLLTYLKTNTGIGVAFNPGTIQLRKGINAFKEFLAVTDILFVNTEEAKLLTDEYDVGDMHIKLQKYGPRMTVITDGKNGASAHDGSMLVQANAYSDSRPVVDKTGAGDAFSAGFLSAIFYGKNMREALLWGTINSGCVIKEIGASRGLLTKDQVQKIIEENKL